MLYTDNGDETITDNRTGLIWTRDGNAPGPIECSPGTQKTWQQALDYAACLNSKKYLGHNDWRLPNVDELNSLVNYAQSDPVSWLNTQGFSKTQSWNYWSSTTCAATTSMAWVVNFRNNRLSVSNKTDTEHVRCVRGGQAQSLGSPFICLPKTGQTTSYAAGDDGSFQVGVEWPVPRYVINRDETITDRLTGLIWIKDGNAPGPEECALGYKKTWQEALNFAACLNANNYLGHNDWRVPDVHELKSLVNFGQPNTASWLNTQGFGNTLSAIYWSSRIDVYDTDRALIVNLGIGNVGYYSKASAIQVLCVRGGGW